MVVRSFSSCTGVSGHADAGDQREDNQRQQRERIDAVRQKLREGHPRKVPPDMNILKFAKFVSDAQQGLVVVPVVGIDGQLMGAVDLHSNLFF